MLLKRPIMAITLALEHRLNDGWTFFKPSSFQLVINPQLVPKAFDCSMFNSWRLHRLLPVKICRYKFRTFLHFWQEIFSLFGICPWRKRTQTLGTLNTSCCRREERSEWKEREGKGRKGEKLTSLWHSCSPYLPTLTWDSCGFCTTIRALLSL